MKFYASKFLLALMVLTARAFAFNYLPVEGDRSFDEFMREAHTALTVQVDEMALRQIASGFDPKTQFLEVLPERPSLHYIDREQARFTLRILTRPTNPDFRIIPTGTFPSDTQEIHISKIGNSYHMETPPLVAGNPVFTARAVLENGAQADAYKKTIAESEGKIVEYQEILTHTSDPAIRAFYERRITTLTSLIQALNSKIASSRLTLHTIATILIVAFNAPPVAVITADPQDGFAPLSVNFSAAGSSDPDSQIVAQAWDFDDGTTGVGMNVTHIFTAAKTYRVKLTVTDDRGKTGTTQILVHVEQDTIAPQISAVPVDGANFVVSMPLITIFYHDQETAVDPSTFHLTINGEDNTNLAVVDFDKAVIQFNEAHQLAQGAHEFVAKIKDILGNESTLTLHYSVDLGIITQGFITGTAIDTEGDPIEGASVEVSSGPPGMKKRLNDLNVTTDAQGNFSLPFPVGGRFFIKISKAGFLESYREVLSDVEYDASAGFFVLPEADPIVTHVEAATGGTAQNSTETLTVEFAPGTLPFDANVRATDYTEPESLPAPLPELSAFTYANNITPKGIPLSEPASVGIKNILNFPDGTEIVVGFFNVELGRWIDSGVSATVSEGKVGVKRDKVECSSGAACYPDPLPPATDVNQPTVPDPTTTIPELAEVKISDMPNKEQLQCPGCIINADSGNLGIEHDLPVVLREGQSFGLTFTYNSTAAFPTAFVATTMTNKVPDPADGVKVNLTFAGQKVFGQFDGVAVKEESAYRAIFVAKNAEGKFLPTGTYPYNFDFGVEYANSQYASANYFGAPPRSRIGNWARVPVSLKKKLSDRAVVLNERESFFGAGWSLAGLERLTMDADRFITLLDGAGGVKIFPMIFQILLVPVYSFKQWIASDEKSGRHERKKIDFLVKKSLSKSEITLTQMVVRSNVMYAADCAHNVVYRYDPSTAEFIVVAGTGTAGFSGDGALAISAELNCPMAVYPAELGGFYIADSNNFRIRKVSSSGIITTIAGNGTVSESPDLTVANIAGIGRPVSVSEDKLFGIHFATTSNKIRFINPRGKLETYAGDSSSYIPVSLSNPTQVIYDELDNPIVVDKGNNRIIKLLANKAEIKSMLGSDILNAPKSICYEAKIRKYYILEESGRILAWDGEGFGTDNVEEIVIDSGVARHSKIAKGKNKVSFQGDPIPSIACGPEVGLILGQNIASARFKKVKQQNNLDDKIGGGAAMPMRPPMSMIVGYREVLIPMGAYSAPTGEFSKITRDGTGFRRTLIDGSYVLYNDHGVIISRVNNDGKNFTYRYNQETYQLEEITIPGGDKYKFYYDGKGHLERVVDPALRETHFSIDEKGDLLSITNPDGSEKTFVYDEEHLVTSTTEESGKSTAFEYQLGRVVKEINEGNRERRIRPAQLVGLIPTDSTYNVMKGKRDKVLLPITRADQIVGEIESVGATCTQKLKVTSKSNLGESENCLGGKTKFIKNKDGLDTKIISPEGREIEFDYASQGRISKTKNERNQTQFSYQTVAAYTPRFDKVQNITDASGNITEFTYSETTGLLTTILDPEQNATTFSYTPQNLLESVTDALDNQTHFEQDAKGNTQAVVDAQNNRSEFTRDNAGNITAVKDAQNRTTSFEVDEMNRVSRVTDE
ncbi:MAG: PKD domain-containing protein [Bdellovibrio sp.]|nr:PKD domain-containing protein [Bdellovibrio sp.]